MIDNVSFQSRTSFVSSPTLISSLENLPKGSFRNLDASSVRTLKPNHNYLATTHKNSLLVIITNGIEGVAKSISTNGNFARSIDSISSAIEDLSKGTRKKLTAWIIGGSKVTNEECGTGTVQAVNGIADAIEKYNNVDLSILAGSGDRCDKVFFSTNNGGLQLVLDKNINQKEWRKSLINYFDIAELSNVSRF